MGISTLVNSWFPKGAGPPRLWGLPILHLGGLTFLAGFLLVFTPLVGPTQPLETRSTPKNWNADVNQLEVAIEGIKGGEDLFRKLEMRYSVKMEFLTPPEKWGKIDWVLKANLTAHLIRQGPDRFFFQRELKSKTVRKPKEETHAMTMLYDGDKLRILRRREDTPQKSGYANVISGEKPFAVDLISPEKMGAYAYSYPLSEFLRGEDPETKNDKNYFYKTVFAGEEILEGLHTVKIERWAKHKEDKQVEGRTYFWFATDRNFIAVRTEGYFPWKAGQAPTTRNEVGDWREVERGILVPYKARDLRWDIDAKGNADLHTRYEIQISSLSLKPDYPDNKFYDLEIPDGFPVYVQRGKNIIENYAQGEIPRPFLGGTRFWLLLGLGVLLLFLVALLTFKKLWTPYQIKKH